MITRRINSLSRGVSPQGGAALQSRSSSLSFAEVQPPLDAVNSAIHLWRHLCGSVTDFHAARSRSTAPSRVVTSSGRLGIVSLGSLISLMGSKGEVFELIGLERRYSAPFLGAANRARCRPEPV